MVEQLLQVNAQRRYGWAKGMSDNERKITVKYLAEFPCFYSSTDQKKIKDRLVISCLPHRTLRKLKQFLP